MPDYAKQGGKVLALQSKSEIRVKYDRTKFYRDKRLEHIDQNDTNCKFSAVNTVEIGQSGVMAAILADIVLLKQEGSDDCAVAAACQIRASRDTEHQRGGSKRQFMHKTPPKNRYRYFTG